MQPDLGNSKGLEMGPVTVAHPYRLPTQDESEARHLGETRCDSCGSSEELVGPLGKIVERLCAYCARETQQMRVLEAEARQLLAPWVEACKRRDVPQREIVDVILMMAEELGRDSSSAA